MLRTVRMLLIGTALSLGAVTGVQSALAAKAEPVAESADSKCGCCYWVRVWTGCCWVWVRVCD